MRTSDDGSTEVKTKAKKAENGSGKKSNEYKIGVIQLDKSDKPDDSIVVQLDNNEISKIHVRKEIAKIAKVWEVTIVEVDMIISKSKYS